MATKLTLTIDKAIIKKAKNFAQEKNKSVSRIVEEYLNNISSGNTPKEFFEHSLCSNNRQSYRYV